LCTPGLGTGVKPIAPLFRGLFGPRGPASILSALLILEGGDFTHEQEVFAAVVVTVVVSVLLRGITAGPFSRCYGARTNEMGDCAENTPVPKEPFSDALEPVVRTESQLEGIFQ